MPNPRPRDRKAWYVRAALVLIAAALVGVFCVAAWLNPYTADGSPRGRATHTQLGLSPCGFLAATGKPCPSCGMTTSFALLVRGNVGAALRANWAGVAIALLWTAAIPWTLFGALRGRLLFVPRGRGEVMLTAMIGVVLALMLVRWAVILAGEGGR